MEANAVYAWNALVRLVHWGVAALVVTELLNEAGANPWHRYLGYAAAVLIGARLAWGAVARGHASLGAIVRTAAKAVDYIAGDRPHHHAGHNPLGAAMALLLWTLIGCVAVTGWMQTLDAFWGDETLQRVHAAAAYVLAGCVVVHVIGVILYSTIYRTNLVMGMLTGWKAVPTAARDRIARRRWTATASSTADTAHATDRSSAAR